jgi:hypothetical protein
VRDFVLRELRDGTLYEVPLQARIPQRAIGVAAHDGIPLSRAAEEFLRLVLDPPGRGEEHV